jgi:hypothetical protein
MPFSANSRNGRLRLRALLNALTPIGAVCCPAIFQTEAVPFSGASAAGDHPSPSASARADLPALATSEPFRGRVAGAHRRSRSPQFFRRTLRVCDNTQPFISGRKPCPEASVPRQTTRPKNTAATMTATIQKAMSSANQTCRQFSADAGQSLTISGGASASSPSASSARPEGFGGRDLPHRARGFFVSARSAVDYRPNPPRLLRAPNDCGNW